MQSFNELNLNPQLIRAISELGFTTPSPIQAQSLPILLEKQTDFLGLAATGTGKTAAFSIPMLQRMDTSLKGVQCLILCPTRELALQISEQIKLLAKYLPVKVQPVYGGAGYSEQISGLKNGANIVVGTPGRIIDHINRGTLKLENVNLAILDEADEMISMGFKEDLEEVLKTVNKEKSNIWLFSATMSKEVRNVANEFLRQPEQVQVNRTEMVPTSIQQLFYRTQESNKPEVLCKLIDAADEFYGLVFCQTKSLVTDLTRYLSDRGYKVDCLHGDKSQTERERTLKLYKEKKLQVLICTDVASRGIDVKDITHVINYSLPRELDSYVHRIGRTARSGKTGFAMSLVNNSHIRLLSKIEQLTKSKIIEGKIPSKKEIAIKKVANLQNDFNAQVEFSKVTELLGEEWNQLLNSMTPQEIAGRFISLLAPTILTDRDLPQMAKSHLQEDRAEGGGRDRRSRGGDRDRGGRGRGERSRDGGGRGERREFRSDSRPSRAEPGSDSASFEARPERSYERRERSFDRNSDRGGERGGERRERSSSSRRGDRGDSRGERRDSRPSRSGDKQSQSGEKSFRLQFKERKFSEQIH